MDTTYDVLLFLGYTASFLGELLVAYAALSVHHRFRHEHKVDEEIFRSMKREQVLAFIGIGMFTLGYALKVISEFYLRNV